MYSYNIYIYIYIYISCDSSHSNLNSNLCQSEEANRTTSRNTERLQQRILQIPPNPIPNSNPNPIPKSAALTHIRSSEYPGKKNYKKDLQKRLTCISYAQVSFVILYVSFYFNETMNSDLLKKNSDVHFERTSSDLG